MKTVVTISLFALTAIALAAFPAAAQDDCCVAPNNGAGTVDLVPQCPYYGPLSITDGVGTATIEIDARLDDFHNISEVSGGNLGGTRVTFDAVLYTDMTGAGDLAGFHRSIQIPVSGTFDFAPRTPGDAVQDFAAGIDLLTGSIFGDPDFDQLEVRAGIALNLPAPGHTTLTRLGPPGSDFSVDSFFDITYEIEFTGQPGSSLEGLGGISEGYDHFELCPGATSVEEETWGGIKALFRSE